MTTTDQRVRSFSCYASLCYFNAGVLPPCIGHVVLPGKPISVSLPPGSLNRIAIPRGAEPGEISAIPGSDYLYEKRTMTGTVAPLKCPACEIAAASFEGANVLAHYALRMDEPVAWFIPRQLNHRVKDLQPSTSLVKPRRAEPPVDRLGCGVPQENCADGRDSLYLALPS
jgi:hypothetical protein